MARITMRFALFSTCCATLLVSRACFAEDAGNMRRAAADPRPAAMTAADVPSVAVTEAAYRSGKRYYNNYRGGNYYRGAPYRYRTYRYPYDRYPYSGYRSYYGPPRYYYRPYGGSVRVGPFYYRW